MSMTENFGWTSGPRHWESRLRENALMAMGGYLSFVGEGDIYAMPLEQRRAELGISTPPERSDE